MLTESNIFVLNYLYSKKTPFAMSVYFELAACLSISVFRLLTLF